MTRSRSICIVLSVALLLILCLTTLPGPMTAQEQGEGMVECFSSSEDATVRLEFPAGGGEVHGSYQSSYTAQDVSLLYDEDGSSDHYAERRRVRMSVQISGSYSGGEGGSLLWRSPEGAASISTTWRTVDSTAHIAPNWMPPPRALAMQMVLSRWGDGGGIRSGGQGCL
jgi:hypothetical protein